jgi:hypothetical protein
MGLDGLPMDKHVSFFMPGNQAWQWQVPKSSKGNVIPLLFHYENFHFFYQPSYVPQSNLLLAK